MAINMYAGSKICSSTLKSREGVATTMSYESVVDFGSDEVKLVSVDEDEVLEVEKPQNKYEKLGEVFLLSGLSVDEVLAANDRDSELYVSALYAKLKAAGLDDQVIDEEINNIVTYGYSYTDFSEEAWQDMFGNFLQTIDRCENVMDYYYPLAKYLHLEECDLTHTYSEFGDGRITCFDIDEKYNKQMNTAISYTDYVISKVYESENEELIYQMDRIICSDEDTEECLLELKTIYELAVVPMCVPEEIWNASFKNLLGTVGVRENVCDVYYGLACFVHDLDCDFEHYTNEFGMQECEQVKLIKQF